MVHKIKTKLSTLGYILCLLWCVTVQATHQVVVPNVGYVTFADLALIGHLFTSYRRLCSRNK